MNVEVKDFVAGIVAQRGAAWPVAEFHDPLSEIRNLLREFRADKIDEFTYAFDFINPDPFDRGPHGASDRLVRNLVTYFVQGAPSVPSVDDNEIIESGRR